MPQNIHPTAVIDPAASIADDVTIGPFCVVGPHVTLGKGVTLRSHVVIDGRTSVGAGTEFHPFASIGSPPQDLKFSGESSSVEIGENNQIREYVTINPGTEGGGMVTRIGSNCLLMIGAHVAHDCQVGNHVILANNVAIAGHVIVGDHAILGGMSAVHQFVRIGAHAMIGGMSAIENDVIPFGLAVGERATLAGLNLVGLDRRGFPRDQVNELRQAFKIMFSGEGTLADRLATVRKSHGGNELVTTVLAFIDAESSRALCQPKPSGR